MVRANGWLYLRRWVRVLATGLLYRPRLTGTSPLTWRTGPGLGSRRPSGGLARDAYRCARMHRPRCAVHCHSGLGSRAQALLWQLVAGAA